MNEAQRARAALELDELEQRIQRLEQFTKEPAAAELSEQEQQRLRLQLQFMKGYANVLTERLEAGA